MSRDTAVIEFRQPEAIDDPFTHVGRMVRRRCLVACGTSTRHTLYTSHRYIC
jgi:hypothetical protein